MGQQESRGGSPAVRRAGTGLEPAVHHGPGTPGGAEAGSSSSKTGRRMEKFLRRAQSLDPRRRGHSTSRRESEYDSSGSSLEGTPTGTPSIRRGAPSGKALAVPKAPGQKRKTTMSAASSVSDQDYSSEVVEGSRHHPSRQPRTSSKGPAPPVPSQTGFSEPAFLPARTQIESSITLVPTLEWTPELQRPKSDNYARTFNSASTTTSVARSASSRTRDSDDFTGKLSNSSMSDVFNDMEAESKQHNTSASLFKVPAPLVLEEKTGFSPELDRKPGSLDKDRPALPGYCFPQTQLGSTSDKKKPKQDQLQSSKMADSMVTTQTNGPAACDPTSDTLPGAGTMNNKVSSDNEAGSLISSPGDDVFLDAASDYAGKTPSPVDSPYMSATQSRHGSTCTQTSNLDASELSAEVTKKLTLQTNLPIEDKASTQISPSRQHRPVAAGGYVVTSRILSATSQEALNQCHLSTSGLDINGQNKISPFSKRKKTSSDMDITLASTEKPAKVGVPKHSLSYDTGLSSQIEGADMVTSLKDAQFNFTEQMSQRNGEDLQIGSSTQPALFSAELPESFSKSVIPSTQFNTWGGRRRKSANYDGSSRNGKTATLGNKKRSRFMSEDVCFNQSQSMPTSPTDAPLPPLYHRPPSRCTSMEDSIVIPKAVPDKLDFKQLEKFEGQMLISWLVSAFDVQHYLHYVLARQDQRVMAAQFCTHLLALGVLRPLEQQYHEDLKFKPDQMYFWAYSEPLFQRLEIIPGKVSSAWPPSETEGAPIALAERDLKSPPNMAALESEHQVMVLGLRRELKDQLSRMKDEYEACLRAIKGEHTKKVSSLESKIHDLEREIEKTKILADIQSLTVGALSDITQGEQEIPESSPVAGTSKVLAEESCQTSPSIQSPVDNKRINSVEVATQVDSDLLTTVTGSLVPPPPPLPGSVPPPPPPLPGGGPPPPPPLPGSGPPPPPPLPGGPPVPPPLPGSVPPPPPPLPGSGPPVPPPLPGGGPPPPPPLPGSGPPPPPPLPGGGPPPPPPVPGGPPPPPPIPGGPPLPPSFGGMATPPPAPLVPRKPRLQPKSPMKPLFWKKLQVKDLDNVVIHTSVADTLWKKLEEPPLNLDEFDLMFSKPMLKKKANSDKPAKTKKTKEVAKLLDAKRSQAVGIFVSSLHLNAVDIEAAILEFDTSTLPLETLQALFDQKPEPAELEMIKNHISTKPDVELDRPDQFLHDLSQIPSFENRCYCLIFQSTFTESIGAIESRLTTIRSTCEFLTTKKSVQIVMGIILSLGNYMNGGTNRGQADGFGLEILPKLRDVKSRDNTRTLLHYVVMQYTRKFDEDAGTEQAKMPLPEPSDISKSGLVNFEDLEVEVDKASQSLSACQGRVSKVIREATEENLEPFKTNMMSFLERAKLDVKEQEKNLSEARKVFDLCTVFFAMKPRPGESSVGPKDFFGLWTSFSTDFKDLWKREQMRIFSEKMDAAQTKVKQIKEEKKAAVTTQKTAKSKTGLKAKLASKGMI